MPLALITDRTSVFFALEQAEKIVIFAVIDHQLNGALDYRQVYDERLERLRELITSLSETLAALDVTSQKLAELRRLYADGLGDGDLSGDDRCGDGRAGDGIYGDGLSG